MRIVSHCPIILIFSLVVHIQSIDWLFRFFYNIFFIFLNSSVSNAIPMLFYQGKGSYGRCCKTLVAIFHLTLSKLTRLFQRFTIVWGYRSLPCSAKYISVTPQCQHKVLFHAQALSRASNGAQIDQWCDISASALTRITVVVILKSINTDSHATCKWSDGDTVDCKL